MRSDLRGRMTKLEGQMAYKSKKKNKKRHEANDFHVGDEVYVISLFPLPELFPRSQMPKVIQRTRWYDMFPLLTSKDLEITKLPKIKSKNQKEMKVVTEDVTAINKSASIRPEINVMGG